MAIHLPIGLERYRDANPVPTSPLLDDITSAPSGPVLPAKQPRLNIKGITYIIVVCIHTFIVK